MAVTVFLDTSVLLAGLVDFGPQSSPAQSVLHAVAEKQITGAGTAWHCCLEFFSVSTRLPPEFRLAPVDAAHLLDAEVFARMTVHDLPAADRLPMMRAAAREGEQERCQRPAAAEGQGFEYFTRGGGRRTT